MRVLLESLFKNLLNYINYNKYKKMNLYTKKQQKKLDQSSITKRNKKGHSRKLKKNFRKKKKDK